jgi:hypothetical protein
LHHDPAAGKLKHNVQLLIDALALKEQQERQLTHLPQPHPPQPDSLKENQRGDLHKLLKVEVRQVSGSFLDTTAGKLGT